MPVEIRELVIKAFIEDGEQSDQAQRSGEGQMPDKEEIIADCMEQISEMLKQQMER